MKRVNIQAGDCCASLAKENGFHDPDIIYQAPQNSAFRRRNTNLHVLRPGDQIVIPDKKTKINGLKLNQYNQFVIKGLVTTLNITLQDFEGQAFTDNHYELEIAGVKYPGQLDGAGKLTQVVNASAKTVLLTVFLDDERKNSLFWTLSPGALQPVNELAGCQARLNNLGFTCANENGVLDDSTRAAIRAFKRKNGLPQNDITDNVFQTALLDQHGC